jgi:hypothetical protein
MYAYLIFLNRNEGLLTMSKSIQGLFISLLLEQRKVLTIGVVVNAITTITQELYASQELYIHRHLSAHELLTTCQRATAVQIPESGGLIGRELAHNKPFGKRGRV